MNFLNHINFILQRDFDDKIITSSMINNYVKGNVIESPIKKKYQKSHVGQLLRISFYKKILEINDCKKLFEFEKHIYKNKYLFKDTLFLSLIGENNSLVKLYCLIYNCSLQMCFTPNPPFSLLYSMVK